MIEFSDAIIKAGINPPPDILADGTLHRFHVTGDRPRTENGWYCLFDDPPAGAFGCWKRGISETWNGKPSETLTPPEKYALRAKMKAARAERERLQAEIHAETRRRATEIWKAAEPATAEHPYLQRKGIAPNGARLSRGSLVLPMRDTSGTLHGLQFIDQDGGKNYLTGTKKVGAYLALGGKPAGVLYVCEGYATGASIHEATGGAVAIAFDAGNLRPVAETLRAKFPGVQLIVCGDNDAWTEGNPGATKAREAAAAVGGLLAMPTFRNTAEQPTDYNDLARLQGLEEVRRQIEAAAVPTAEQGEPAEDPSRESCGLRVIDVRELLTLELPPRETILTPWLPAQGLCMVYAPRGVGKTHFSLGVSYAVACGGKFLPWEAPTPREVLFLDGEMPAAVLQERLARIAISNDKEPYAPLRIVTPDLQPRGMIDLSRPDDQAELAPFLDGAELIVVDNLSTLCRTGRENEAEGWLPVQQWALAQRAAGRSVLFIHHAGKNGEQRGTSRREDVLDTVISLRRPGDYTPEQGACFEVHFEKARGLYGEDTRPFVATLSTTPDGKQEWLLRPLEESNIEKVAALINDGVPQNEISELLGITKGTVSKAKKKAAGLGLLRAVA